MARDALARFASPRRTVGDTLALLSRARYRRVFYAVGALYLLAYLFVVGDISLGGRWDLTVTRLTRAFRRTGFASFEAVASVGTPYATLLVSPVNLLVGAALGALVGANVSFSYYSWRNPAACDTRNAAGVASSVPALLAGTACCGPLVLVVLGIQASAALLAFFRLALPASVLLLLVSLAYVVERTDLTDPTAASGGAEGDG